MPEETRLEKDLRSLQDEIFRGIENKETFLAEARTLNVRLLNLWAESELSLSVWLFTLLLAAQSTIVWLRVEAPSHKETPPC